VGQLPVFFGFLLEFLWQITCLDVFWSQGFGLSFEDRKEFHFAQVSRESEIFSTSICLFLQECRTVCKMVFGVGEWDCNAPLKLETERKREDF